MDKIVFYRESVFQSLVADFSSFGIMFGGLWLNHKFLGDSNFLNWLLILMILFKAATHASSQKIIFTDKDKLIEYLNK